MNLELRTSNESLNSEARRVRGAERQLPSTKYPELRTILLLFLLLAAYALPWQSAPFAAMTNHAYDLAEWTTILTRGETPALLTPLLLRLPLACLAVWIGLAGRGVHPVVRVLAVLLIAAALLPPLEFFTIGREDWNYRQQFALALGAGGLGLAGSMLAAWLGRRTLRGGRALLLVAAGAALWGTARAVTLMSGLGLEVQWGIGAPLFALACGVAAAMREQVTR